MDKKINIEEFLHLAKTHPVLDVRSPGEYKHAHIPKAYNLPLFTNEERAAVGTAYKQESRERAIKLGLDIFGPKMKKMVEEVEGISTSKTLLIHCWRGGMRSAAVAWLMGMYGYKVYTLVGGYKKFRNYVLDTFTLPFHFNILGGYTGSGKTEALKEIHRLGHQMIDLEEIAKHKGSAFGNIGLPEQPAQEMFENLLALEIRKLSDSEQLPIWLEDESQRIGTVNIPTDLWNNMRRSQVFFLDIPFEERLDHIVSEYGGLDQERMINAISRISQRLGGLETKNAISLLSEGKTRESFRILLTYYDRWYLKALHNRESLNSLLITVKCGSVDPLNANKLLLQPEYHEKP